MALLDPLFGAAAMDEVFADNARLQHMLDFEAALANAQAQCGVITPATARAIGSKCNASLLDAGALADAAALSLNPAIPLLHHLTALLANDDPQPPPFVHSAPTSHA